MKTYKVKYLENQYDEQNDEFYELNGGEFTETLSDGENAKEAAEGLAEMWKDKEFYSRRYYCEQDEINFEFKKVFENYDEYVLRVLVKGEIMEKIYIEVIGGEE